MYIACSANAYDEGCQDGHNPKRADVRGAKSSFGGGQCFCLHFSPLYDFLNLPSIAQELTTQKNMMKEMIKCSGAEGINLSFYGRKRVFAPRGTQTLVGGI
jgi:hypothetical protein